MARGRWISPDFYDDTVLAQCSHSARLLFPALWQLADRCGVFEWDERQIRKHAFGYDEMTMISFRSLMDELHLRGFIKRAEHGGKVWGLVVNMAKRQTFHKDEKEKHRAILETAKWEHGLSTVPAPCSPVSSTVPIQLSLESNPGVLRSETGDLSQISARTKKPEPTPVALVRRAFLDGYAARYPLAPKYPWGAREGGAAKNLLKSVTLEEAIQLVLWFFSWKRPEVIKAGHPFCVTSNSLVMKYHELRADLAHPERRAFAAEVHNDEKQAIHNAEGDAQTARIVAKITGAQDDHEPFRPLAGNGAAFDRRGAGLGGDSQQALERRGDRDVVQGAGAVHTRQRLVASARGGGRGGADAERASHAGTDAWPPRDAGIHADDSSDPGGESEG
jgi:hypothetical protein